MANALIINGSPRKNGDTRALIDAFLEGYGGNYRMLSAEDGISPCVDCRYCHSHAGCAIGDTMQAVYREMDAFDTVVIASPVWYSALSGVTLDICSRFQTYFAARRFRGDRTPMPQRRGVLLLTGGMRGTERAPIDSARVILRLLGVPADAVTTVVSMDTDRVPAKDDTAAIEAARLAGLACCSSRRA